MLNPILVRAPSQLMEQQHRQQQRLPRLPRQPRRYLERSLHHPMQSELMVVKPKLL